MRTLIDNVLLWAKERNILEGSTAIKQLDKTSEEFNELQRAVSEYSVYKMLELEGASKEAHSEIVDAFGDILVTLIIAAHMLGVDLEVALEAAWEEIKDRKGVLRNGKFIKEADL